MAQLRQARDASEPVSGTVIGWNRGGFHVVVAGLAAFCPNSEMELGRPRRPDTYLDRELDFHVLNVRGRGKHVVLSRRQLLEQERKQQRAAALARLSEGSSVTGQVVSLTDFGAFVDLGGVHGLVHKSEISHRPVESPDEVLSVGQEVTVKVTKIDRGSERIGLSMRALEPDPWQEAAETFTVGTVIEGTVTGTERLGAFIEIAPGVVGLLPTVEMALPVETTPERAYPPGRKVRVQVLAVDARRRRIRLVREGAQLGGTEADYRAYAKRQTNEPEGFTPLARALQRLNRKGSDS